MNRTASGLLNRPPLWPDESLNSYLIRLTQANCYPSLTTLKQVCYERLSRRDAIARPTRPETLLVLAELTRGDPVALYAASAQRFAPLLLPPTHPAPYIQLPDGPRLPILTVGFLNKLIWPENDVQFCPCCLQSHPYHRVTWLPLPVTVCLQHHCLLQRGCPACHRPVATGDLLTGCCPRCQYPFAQTPVISIANHDLGLMSQLILQTWLGLSPSPYSVTPPPFPSQPPAVLFRFLDGLRRAMMAVPDQWPYLYLLPDLAGLSQLPCASKRDLTPAKTYLLYASACKALFNWPQNFYDFLDAYRYRDGPPQNRGIHVDLGNFYYAYVHKDWQQPAFAFVKQAFDPYLRNLYPPAPEPTNGLLGDYLGASD